MNIATGCTKNIAAPNEGRHRTVRPRFRRIAFGQLGMRRIEIRCATGNLPSNRIPQRLGWRLDRTDTCAEQLSSGEWIDLNVYVSEK